MHYRIDKIAKKLKNNRSSKLKFYQKKYGKFKKYKLYEIEEEGKENIMVDIASPKYKKFKNRKMKKNYAKKNKNKKKGIITSIIAVGMASIMAVSAGIYWLTKLNKKNNGSSGTTNSASQTFDGLDTGSLDLLGVELPTEGNNTEYTKVSGDFNIEDVVRGADGVLYDSQESADNASKVGTTVIDTKGGSLVVEDNGKVYTQEEGYEVIDKQGNVVDSGNGSVPDVSYEEDIEYVVCPCNYYDDEGTLVHTAGDYITPEELQLCRQYYHTTKPKDDEYTVVEEEIIYFDEPVEVGSNETTSSNGEISGTGSTDNSETDEVTYDEETTVSSSNEGVTNSDGTYTIYGVTYASYADYQQYIINGGDGYGYIDGIIQPIGDYEIETQYTL